MAAFGEYPGFSNEDYEKLTEEILAVLGPYLTSVNIQGMTFWIFTGDWAIIDEYMMDFEELGINVEYFVYMKSTWQQGGV